MFLLFWEITRMPVLLRSISVDSGMYINRINLKTTLLFGEYTSQPDLVPNTGDKMIIQTVIMMIRCDFKVSYFFLRNVGT